MLTVCWQLLSASVGVRGKESEVIRKITVLQLAPTCPLDTIASVFCGLFHDPVYDKQE